MNVQMALVKQKLKYVYFLKDGSFHQRDVKVIMYISQMLNPGNDLKNGRVSKILLDRVFFLFTYKREAYLFLKFLA